MTFDVKEEDEKVIVFVELPHQRRTGKVIERQRIQTEEVTRELSLREIEHGKAIQLADVQNWQESTRRGTWIFEKKKIDKSAEKVILPIEEEKPAPKKRKSRAKKKTTK